MKPLFLIITGIDHLCDEFNFYKSIMEKEYEVECVPLVANDLKSPERFSALIDDIGKFQLKSRKIVIMAHSFGCIVALYLIKNYDIESNAELIFVDPTTQYMKQHAKRIDEYLGVLLDNAPRNITSQTTVFTYLPKGCSPKSCLQKHIDQHADRVSAIEQLWSNPDHPKIISLYLPSTKLPYIPHNLHRILPNNIGKHMAIPIMTAGKYIKRRKVYNHKTFRVSRKTRYRKTRRH